MTGHYETIMKIQIISAVSNLNKDLTARGQVLVLRQPIFRFCPFEHVHDGVPIERHHRKSGRD